MKSTIILGAGFGDEGKGRTVNDFCDSNSIVVRFSGGQQAGHTVIYEGVKHIFSSYGAGTLKNCPSFFTEDTTFYLPNILNEKYALHTKGINNPQLYLHPLAMVTTPYDIAYNRAKEGLLKHGSCGLGIGATMNRTLKTGHKLFAIDFTNFSVLTAKLKEIRNYYWKLIESETSWNAVARMDFLENAQHQEDVFFDCLEQEELPFKVCQLKDLLNQRSNLVFEGSQGILLDMDHGVFPNVTYANTTSKNALKYCGKATQIVYVSRCYSTRHGNGWFEGQQDLNLINNEEEINVTNRYQGDFKTAELNYDLLNYAISVDSIYSSNIKNKTLTVTCLDQRPDFVLDFSKLHETLGTVVQKNTP